MNPAFSSLGVTAGNDLLHSKGPSGTSWLAVRLEDLTCALQGTIRDSAAILPRVRYWSFP